MTGFEVVGVVLGILPLIISAIEHYNDIVDPIVTYRKYSTALQTLMTEINAQRDIFQNECLLILSQFVDQHALEDMLKDPKHDLRRQLKIDQDVQENLTSMIGSHAGQLQGILSLINTSLIEIYEETRDLPNGLERPRRNDVSPQIKRPRRPDDDRTLQDDPRGLKAWRSHVRQKLKLSLRKDFLNQQINDLRNRNQTFLALCQQIVRFNVSWTPARTPGEVQSMEITLGKFQKLRSMSQMLYQHLEKLSSCSDHADHSANLRLHLETTELYLDTPPKMSFEMAITYWDVDQPATEHQEPILLAIESTVEKTIPARGNAKKSIRFSEPQDDEELQPSQIQRQKSAGLEKKEGEKESASQPSRFRGLWKKLTGDEAVPAPAATSSVRLADRDVAKLLLKPVMNAAAVPPQAPPANAVEPSDQDLSSITNLCTHMLEDVKAGSSGNSCIGYLAGQGTDRYMVYKRQSTPSAHSTAMSLSKLIISHRRQQSLPKPDKWRLAGALSLGVLLYNSTPWLRTELKSDDILLFGPSDPWRTDSLKYPHLHSSPRQTRQGLEKSVLARDGYIKNEVLHCLGVILLELEFEDTLESLIVELEVDDRANADVPLTQQLLLLKRRAGTQLGTLYGRIVRMCLDCDFGLGLDEYTLDDPKVQRVFYSQVVKQFQDRMPEYSKIWSDD